MRQCMDAENLHRRLNKIIGQVRAIDRMGGRRHPLRGRARADKRREISAPPRRADSPRGPHKPLRARRHRARRRRQDDKKLHQGRRALRKHEVRTIKAAPRGAAFTYSCRSAGVCRNSGAFAVAAHISDAWGGMATAGELRGTARVSRSRADLRPAALRPRRCGGFSRARGLQLCGVDCRSRR